MVSAIIFDMDGVMIDSEPLWKQAEIEVFGSVGVSLTEAMCEQTTGLRMESTVRYWFDRFPWTGKSLADVQHETVARVAELVRSSAAPLPGLEHAIAFATERGLRLGLCTSSPYVCIDAVLERLGLRERFDVVYSAEDEPYGKPHPGAYLTTAARLDAEPRRCIVFEDSLNGAISAKAASMKTVAVLDGMAGRTTRFDFCDAVVATLAEFDDALFVRLGGSPRTSPSPLGA